MSHHDPTDSGEAGQAVWLDELALNGAGAYQAPAQESASSPTGANAGEEPSASAGGALPLPFPPIPVPLRPVSGRYRGTWTSYQLELRVDVDRVRPTRRVSGDFFQVSGSTTTYVGSFVVSSPTITSTASQIVIRGLGSFSFAAGNPVVQVTIPRRSLIQPQAPASVLFLSTSGTPGATYPCPFESIYFRSVRLETDRVSDVTTPVFSSYNTGSFPSGGPARNLSVVSAYAEAGIELSPTTGSDVVNITEAGPNVSWSNAELHASMQRHFTLWRDAPQWAVWQLVAQNHDIGPSLYGIMFDQQGAQRQGSAVFHRGIGGTTPDRLRLQLYTYVHETGHAFNLLHSWQKSLGTPPVPNRPLSLSWMNYPFNYPAPGGEATYWSRFAFQFDDEEIIHLRHAYRNNIIQGGSNFAAGSALGVDVLPDPMRDDSGLQFDIATHKRKFAFGEPVVLELTLAATDLRGRHVHTWLHPNFGLVQIVISKPSGVMVAYEPLIEHLVGPREVDLAGGEAVRDSAYIGFGKGGNYFDQPGDYKIRAAYAALDGSQVLSDILTVRVAYPVTAADEELADLFIGDEQGTLLYLLGSDNEALRRGNEAFDLVLSKYPKHTLANYARLVKGVNAGRSFKTISPDGSARLSVRPAQVDDSASLLSQVTGSGVLDTVSQQFALTRLAAAQTAGGNEAAAAKTLDQLSAVPSAASVSRRKKR